MFPPSRVEITPLIVHHTAVSIFIPFRVRNGHRTFSANSKLFVSTHLPYNCTSTILNVFPSLSFRPCFSSISILFFRHVYTPKDLQTRLYTKFTQFPSSLTPHCLIGHCILYHLSSAHLQKCFHLF